MCIAVKNVWCASRIAREASYDKHLCGQLFFRKRRIYNLTSSAEYKLTWSEIIEIGRDVINTRMPLNGVAWYPGGSMKRSRLHHLVCFYLFHIVPAIIVDVLLLVLGYKPV